MFLVAGVIIYLEADYNLYYTRLMEYETELLLLLHRYNTSCFVITIVLLNVDYKKLTHIL